jgi:hypothetical protein
VVGTKLGTVESACDVPKRDHHRCRIRARPELSSPEREGDGGGMSGADNYFLFFQHSVVLRLHIERHRVVTGTRSAATNFVSICR